MVPKSMYNFTTTRSFTVGVCTTHGRVSLVTLPIMPAPYPIIKIVVMALLFMNTMLDKIFIKFFVF